MSRYYLLQAANTLNAKWYTLWLARFFGTHYEGRDGTTVVKMVEWRGRSYLLDVER